MQQNILRNTRYRFFDLKTDEEKVIMALKMILVNVGITGISFVLNVKKDGYVRVKC